MEKGFWWGRTSYCLNIKSFPFDYGRLTLSASKIGFDSLQFRDRQPYSFENTQRSCDFKGKLWSFTRWRKNFQESSLDRSFGFHAWKIWRIRHNIYWSWRNWKKERTVVYFFWRFSWKMSDISWLYILNLIFIKTSKISAARRIQRIQCSINLFLRTFAVKWFEIITITVTVAFACESCLKTLTTGMSHQSSLSILFGCIAVKFLGETSIVIIERFHFFLESIGIWFLNFFDFLDIFFMFIFMSIEIDSANRVECNRRIHFFFKEVFIRIFAKPRMS